MHNTLRKLTNFVLQNTPTLVLFFIPLFFLTNTVDFFAFNKFYLLNIVASISLIFWCLQNILNNRINLTLSPSLSALFVLVLVHFTSAIFMSPTTVLSLTGFTTLFSSLFIIHLAYSSTNPSKKVLRRHIYALLSSLVLMSLLTILHFFNLSSYIFGADITQSKFFNLTGGILPALTFSVPLLLGTLAYIYYEEHFVTKIFLFSLTGVIITATIINISLILPKDGVSPIISLPLKASWSIALDIFKYPGTAIIGTGPETYLATFTRLRPSYLNNLNTLWNNRFGESGSLFLTLLTTTGLAGGLSFLYLFLKNISLGLKKISSSEEKPQIAFVTVSLIGYLVAFIFTSAGIVSIIIAITLLGLITQLLHKDEERNIKNLQFNISSEGHQNRTLSYFLPVFVTIISVTTISLYWFFGAKFYMASMLINQARLKYSTDLTGSFLNQQQAQTLNSYDSTYPIILSQTYQQVALFYLQKETPTEQDKKNSLETMQRAIDFGRIAAKLDPYNVLVWENLSSIYQSFIGAAEGAENLAVSHIAQAISLDPTNPRLRLQLGILYYNLKDKDQAIKLINQSQDLKPNWEVPYVNLYRISLENKDGLKAQNYLKQAIALTNPSSPDYEKLETELTKLTELLKTSNSTSSAQLQN